MRLLNSIFHRGKDDLSYLDQRIVWGILVPRRIQLAYKMMAKDLRLPISVFVRDILERWLVEQGIAMSEDKVKMHEYGDYLVMKYLQKVDLEERE